MHAIILTEGGYGTGFGHIYRCQAVSQALNEYNITSGMIINGDTSIADLNLDVDFSLQNWMEDILNIGKYSGDFIIIDSYLAQKNLFAELTSFFRLGVYFDDFNRLVYPPGLIINGSIGAHLLKYPRQKHQEYLLGTEYQPLRREFWSPEKNHINRAVRKVLITLGGSDMLNITPLVLNALKDKNRIKKIIVIGKGFTNIDEIMKFDDGTCRFVKSPDAREMKMLMQQADIAISASGQTLYELARVGLPTISIGVAKNQDINIRGWLGSKFIEFAGWGADEQLSVNLSDKFNLLLDHDVRVEKANNGRKMIDGHGALRIVKRMMEKVKQGKLHD